MSLNETNSFPSEKPKVHGLLSASYRAIWRWHFYAGLAVLPILCLMALTGGLYLFKDEVDAAIYAKYSKVEPAAQSASPDAWVRAAEKAVPGRASNVFVSASTNEAIKLTVDLHDGSMRTVFVNPASAQVTGVTRFGGVMETVKGLHSLSIVGQWANYIVEIVAGWAIILIATGTYLWWPRKRNVGVLKLSATDHRARPFWRDFHAITGFYAGGIILFLAVTGMPWSAFWGAQFGEFVRTQQIGRPQAPPAASAFVHAKHPDVPLGVGWTMEAMVMPHHHTGHASLDTVIKAADNAKMAKPYRVSIPKTSGVAFTVAHDAKQVENTRILYVDGSSGVVKADIQYEAFGIGAKAFEWGIAVHQGTQYGRVNQLIMLGGCVAVWLLAISGTIMWWKRRPNGRLGAPPAPYIARGKYALLCIVLPLGLLFPLTGLSLLAVLGLDFGYRTIRRHYS